VSSKVLVAAAMTALATGVADAEAAPGVNSHSIKMNMMNCVPVEMI